MKNNKFNVALTTAFFSLPVIAQESPATQIEGLEEVVITSSRVEQPLREVATSVSVITREDLELKGYTSLAEVLRTQTSIGVSNQGGTGAVTSLRIRGEEGYRTLVMIDGVDMSDPTGTQVGPLVQNLANTQDIERIEILRGAQGFLYGADAGGVINVITRSGTEGLSGNASVETGSDGAMNLGGNVRGGTDNLDFSLAVTDTSTDGFNSRSDDTVLQDDDAAENTSIHFKGGMKISPDLSATLVYRDIDAVSEYDSCYTATSTLSNDCLGETRHGTARLSLDYVTGAVGHTFAYAVTDVQRDYFTENTLSYGTEGETSQAEYVGNLQISDSQQLVFGSDYEKDEITTTGSESDQDQLGVFAEYQSGFNEVVFVTAGLRYDDNSDFGKHISYRASAAYVQDLASGDSIKYRTTYGTGFRAPSLSEVAYNAGPFGNGVSLKEETSRGYDLGVDYLMQNGTEIQITYFDQEIDNEIYFDLVTFGGYLQTGDRSTSRGVETAVEYPVSSQVSLIANHTYNKTEDSTGDIRVRRPRHLANLGVEFALLDARLNILANVRVARDAVDNGSVPLDDYEVIDLSANYRLANGLEAFGRIENLADEDYEEVTGYNTRDRSFYAGMRYRF
jgi:vitamin B12 transporter